MNEQQEIYDLKRIISRLETENKALRDTNALLMKKQETPDFSRSFLGGYNSLQSSGIDIPADDLKEIMEQTMARTIDAALESVLKDYINKEHLQLVEKKDEI